MRRLILLIICISTLSCANQSDETSYSIDGEKVYLIITENTTKDQLVSISTKFKSIKNIDIDFSETVFYHNGKVKNLNLKVDCNDGFKGIAKNFGTTFSLNNCGFERDYSKDAEKPWRIGSM